MNALFLIVRSNRDHSAKLLAAILVAKPVYMRIEKLKEVTLIFSKDQSTLLPGILSGDRLQFVVPGQTKTRVDKNSYSLRAEGSQ